MPGPQLTSADAIVVCSPPNPPTTASAEIQASLALHPGEAHTFELSARAEAATTARELATVSLGATQWIKLVGSSGSVTLHVGDQETTVGLDPTEWHLYTVSIDPGTSVEFFVDAEPVATLAAPHGAPAPTDAQAWSISVFAFEAAFTRLWKGTRLQEQVEQSTFGCTEPYPPELRSLVDFGQIPARDLLSTGTTVSLTGGAVYQIETEAARFPDTSTTARIDCHTSEDLLFAAQASFTLEVWFHYTSLDTAGLNALVARANDMPGRESAGYLLALDPLTGKLVACREGSRISSGVTVEANTWTHGALVYDGEAEQLRLFVNGQPQGMVAAGEANTCDASTSFVIGAASEATQSGSPRQFKGLISEVRAWSVARTQQQLAEQMLGHPLLEPGLVAYYEFDESSCGDMTCGHPEVTLTGVTIETHAQRVPPTDMVGLRSAPAPPRYEPTNEDLQAALARLSASMASLERSVIPPTAPDHSWLEQLDQSGFPVVLDVEEGVLVMRDARAPGQPIIVRAVTPDDEKALWIAQILICAVDLVLGVFGLKLVGGRTVLAYVLRMLGDGKVLASVKVLMWAVSAHALVSLMIDLWEGGYLTGMLWALLDISWWGLLRFLGTVGRMAAPAGWLLVLVALAIGIVALINLVVGGPPNQRPNELLRIEMFQAKWGDAILLSGASVLPGQADPPAFSYILVDCGPPGTYAAIKERLPQKIDNVCVTHIDRDHIAGIIELFEAMPQSNTKVGQLLFNAPPPKATLGFSKQLIAEVFDASGRIRDPLGGSTELDDDPSFILRSVADGNKLEQLANQRKVPIAPTKKGSTRMTIGTVEISFSGPEGYNIERLNKRVKEKIEQGRAYSEAANRASIIFSGQSARLPAANILMTGDAWDRVDKDPPPAPANTYRTDIRGNVSPDASHYLFLKVPHHGSASPQPPANNEAAKSEDQNFYSYCTADNYLISASDARHELPTLFALQALVDTNKQKGVTGYRIYCTNKTDNIKKLSEDPSRRPSVAKYRLYALNQGAPSLKFELKNGAIESSPAEGAEVTQLDPW